MNTIIVNFEEESEEKIAYSFKIKEDGELVKEGKVIDYGYTMKTMGRINPSRDGIVMDLSEGLNDAEIVIINDEK